MQQNIQIFFLIILGLSFGSFATMASYRLAKGGNFFSRSQCVNCHKKLGIFNLIPVFSYLFQKGKCSNCSQKISIRYPVIEIFTALFFVAIYFANKQNIDLNLLILTLMALCIVILIVTDLEHYIIPDEIQIAMLILAVFYNINNQNDLLILTFSAFFYSAFGFFLYYLFLKLTKKEAIGMGDIKFLAIVGLLLGFEKFSQFMFLSGSFGVILALIWRKLTGNKLFPFGPSLSLALMISLFFNFTIFFAG